MIVRHLDQREKNEYNQVVKHPIQSWEWGEFRTATGNQVERLGFFNGKKLVNGLQVVFSKIPKTNYTIGYSGKGFMPDDDQLDALADLARKYNAIYIKLEPNIAQKVGATNSAFDAVNSFMRDHGAIRGKSMFTKYTFWLDLKPTEEDLFASLASKTRYNTRLALKKGVQIVEDSSTQGMEQYIALMEETTKRQKFFQHNGDYFRTLQQKMGSDKKSMMRIFHALYQDKVLTSWITFKFNGRFYYPYGASSSQGREVMPNNLMMWEMIRYAKEQNCDVFDMWGSLGPEPDKNDPWYGFHKFKQGYGAQLMEYIGTFDIVYQPQMYRLFNFADKWRWRFLKLRNQLKRN